MNVIIGLVAVLLERYISIDKWHHRFSWFNHYLKLVNRFAARLPSWGVVALTVLPIPFALSFFVTAFEHGVFHLFAFIFSCLILLYCLGPVNSLHALSQNTDETVDANQVVTDFNGSVVGVIFWYASLGLWGGALYRMTQLSIAHLGDANDETKKLLHTLQQALDWLPARLLGLAYALGSHFMPVFNVWRGFLLKGLDSSAELLQACGKAALSDGDTPAAIAHLFDRTLVILLVIWSLIVIL